MGGNWGEVKTRLKAWWKWLKENKFTRPISIVVFVYYVSLLLLYLPYFIRPYTRVWLGSVVSWIFLSVLITEVWLWTFYYLNKTERKYARKSAIYLATIAGITIPLYVWSKWDVYEVLVARYEKQATENLARGVEAEKEEAEKERLDNEQKRQELLAKKAQSTPPANEADHQRQLTELQIQTEAAKSAAAEFVKAREALKEADESTQDDDNDPVVIQSVAFKPPSPDDEFVWDKELFPTDDRNKIDEVCTVFLNSTTNPLIIPATPIGSLVMNNEDKYQLVFYVRRVGRDGIERRAPYYWQLDGGGKGREGSVPAQYPTDAKMQDGGPALHVKIRLAHSSDVVEPDDKGHMTKVYWFYRKVVKNN